MQPPPFTIRLAMPADCDRIANIYNEYLGKSTMDLSPKTGDDYRQQMQEMDDREMMLVLDDGETVTGWGVLKKYSPREGYRFTGETSVYLDPGFLGRGLGKRLKLELIEKARNLGYKHLVARINSNNETSIGYNLKLGYEWVGIQKMVGNVNGKWLDVAILQLIL